MYQGRYRDGCLYLAERIPHAEVLEMTSGDTSIYGDPGVAEAVKQFLSEGRVDTAPERVLTTVLFTDIVESTSRAAEIGDSRWRALLDAHRATVRAQLARHGGREIQTIGDGFFATFDGPARAIACADGAIHAVGELGLDIRAGVHTGEVEIVANTIEGIAVHIGARIVAQARPGEVLVSSVVRDLAAGSGIAFDDRGTKKLKGVPGEWHLYAARPATARIGEAPTARSL
jgi:class 3 adenylate cyclase